MCRESEPEEISDDEDQSWRVRKASARLLACILRAYPALLPEIYSQASKALISKFKEREENVRLEILSTFAELIAQVGAFATFMCTDSAQLSFSISSIMMVLL